MKLLSLSLALFLSISTATLASTPYFEGDVTAQTQASPLRGIISLLLKNTSNVDLVVMIAPSELNNIAGSSSVRIKLGALEEKNLTLNLGAIPAQKKYLVIDYTISYVNPATRALSPVETQPEFFVYDSRNNSYLPTDARVYTLEQQPIYNPRTTRAQPAVVDLGTGLKIESTLEDRGFAASIPLPEDDRVEIEPFDAPDAKVLAESLRINSLPGPIVIPFAQETKSFDKDNKAADCTKLKCFSGQLVLMPDGFKPKVPAAWGYVVELWGAKYGFYTKIAEGETGFMGLWSIAVDPKDVQNDLDALHVIFKPMNRYVQVIDPVKNKPYQFFDTVIAGQFKKSTFRSMAAWYVVRIFSTANGIWKRLTKGNLNPLNPFASVRIIYPNAMKLWNGTGTPCTYKKSKDEYIPWSCSVGGAIYVIPTSDMERLIGHELAHEFHRNYWGKFPAGSGGDHSLMGCYNQGLAIVEGFANFISIWAQGKSYDDAPKKLHGYSLEVNGTYCKEANNEFDAAATLWDLYDRVAETTSNPNKRDNITYNSDTAPIADFLSAGVQSGMPAYRQWLTKKHPESTEQDFFEVFNLNNMVY